MDRAPRVRRVTFLPSPPHIPHRVPDDIGLWTPTLPRPRGKASHAVRVPRVGSLPPDSFRSHLAMGPLAVRLGVPVIKVSKGLAPSSHFPVGFRLPVDSAVMALRAMPGARRVARRSYPLQAPTDPAMPDYGNRLLGNPASLRFRRGTHKLDLGQRIMHQEPDNRFRQLIDHPS
jgi:hypothetical protein